MSDKPKSSVKRFAKYAANFHRKALSESTDPEDEQIRKDLILQNLEDLERYDNLLENRISEGRDKHNRGKKMVRAENLEEARAVYKDGDSGELLRRKLAGRSVIVSERTARNYIKLLKKR